jgi:hypothetical protein
MSIILWKEIHEIANKVCKHFRLKYNAILPETRKQVRFYGECVQTPKGKNIYIRIHQLGRPRRPLAASTILDTLAHELAHLRHWGHDKKHKELHKQILVFIRELGYSEV